MVRVRILKLLTLLIFSLVWFIIGYYFHDFQMSKVELTTPTSNRLLQSGDISIFVVAILVENIRLKSS